MFSSYFKGHLYKFQLVVADHWTRNRPMLQKVVFGKYSSQMTMKGTTPGKILVLIKPTMSMDKYLEVIVETIMKSLWEIRPMVRPQTAVISPRKN